MQNGKKGFKFIFEFIHFLKKEYINRQVQKGPRGDCFHFLYKYVLVKQTFKILHYYSKSQALYSAEMYM